MDRNMIEKLGELSMIDIEDENVKELGEGLDELVIQLKRVAELSLDQGEWKSKRRTEIREDRSRENIGIDDINTHTEDGYVKISRTVGE